MIPELQALGLAGLVIHALKDWVSHNKEGRAYPLTKSLPAYLLSAITTGVLIYLKDDISNIYVITPFSALVLGYLGNSVFFSFIKAKEKDLPLTEPAPKPADKPEGDDGLIGPRPDDRKP